MSRKQDYQSQLIELDAMTCKKLSNSTKEIEQHKKEKLYYTYRKTKHFAQEHQQKPIHKKSKKKTQKQLRKTTQEINMLEATKGKGAYNSPKEINVIDSLLQLEFQQQVNNKLDNKTLEVEINVVGLEKALSHLELESNMLTLEKWKEVD